MQGGTSGVQKRKSMEDPPIEGPPSKVTRSETAVASGHRTEESIGVLSPDAKELLDAKIADGLLGQNALDDRVMRLLASMPPQSHLPILQQFFQTEVSGMKNPSAYLNGVIMSYKKFGPQQGKVAKTLVGRRLDDMYRSGFLKPGDLDERSLAGIYREPEDIAMMALDFFCEKLGPDVRNVSAFFTAQLKAARIQAPTFRGGGPPPPMFGDGPPMMLDGPPMRGDGPPMGPPMMPMPAFPPMARPPFPRHDGPRPVMMPPPAQAVKRGPPPPGMTDFTDDQIAEGVRVDEFHSCSEFARCVPPYAAKELQKLFDQGIPLVDMMDHGAWRQLASLSPGEAIDVIHEISQTMRDTTKTRIRNVNAFFTSVVKKRAPGLMERMREMEAKAQHGMLDDAAAQRPRMGDRHRAADGVQPETHRVFAHEQQPVVVQPMQNAAPPPMGGPVYGYGTTPMGGPNVVIFSEPQGPLRGPGAVGGGGGSAPPMQGSMLGPGVPSVRPPGGPGPGPGMQPSGMAPQGGHMMSMPRPAMSGGNAPQGMGMSAPPAAGLQGAMASSMQMGLSGAGPLGGPSGGGAAPGGMRGAPMQGPGATGGPPAGTMGQQPPQQQQPWQANASIGRYEPQAHDSGHGMGAGVPGIDPTQGQGGFMSQPPASRPMGAYNPAGGMPPASMAPRPSSMMPKAPQAYDPAAAAYAQAGSAYGGGYGGIDANASNAAPSAYNAAAESHDNGYGRQNTAAMSQGYDAGYQQPSYGGYAQSASTHGAPPGGGYSGAMQGAQNGASTSAQQYGQQQYGQQQYGQQQYGQQPYNPYLASASSNQQPGGYGQPPKGMEMSYVLQNRISEMVQRSNGMLYFEAFDANVCAALNSMPLALAQRALQDLQEADVSTVADLPGFILAMIKRYQHVQA